VVLNIVANIPYGQVITYGDIAQEAARRLGKTRMSAQAVGGAVGWNPICLIIPCHRVIGAKGTLTGYGGGMMNKLALLRLEGHRGTEKGISYCVTD
jgi:methylated-DNA-[protein]-cysteine S-methyltransferase